MALVRNAIFGVAATDNQSHHPVAELPAFDIGTERRDLAGNLESRNVRRAGRRRIEAHALHDIGTVHAGGGHLYENFAGARDRGRALLGYEHVRAAGSLDADCGHCCW